jgi:hypothetical protein
MLRSLILPPMVASAFHKFVSATRPTAPPQRVQPFAASARCCGRNERRETMADLKKGDDVTWNSHGGTAHGTVQKKQTSDTEIKGHTVRASKDDPQYIVESDNGGKAAHKATALKKA